MNKVLKSIWMTFVNESASSKMTDSVTGLYKREFLNKIICQINQKNNYPIAIVIVDINRFSKINNDFGYRIGDQLLGEIGKAVLNFMSKNMQAIRWGGDEILLLIPNSNAKATNRLCQSLKKCMTGWNKLLSPKSISMGYSIMANPESSFYYFIKDAENILKKVKLLESESHSSSIITSMLHILSEKSAETEAHTKRLYVLSSKLAKRIGIQDGRLVDLELLCKLHDIGKITISESILHKPGKLDNQEWQMMKGHTESGYRLLSSIPELEDIAYLVLCHHERFDGKGYPKGLVGKDIPLLSRIISITDAFDAMTNDRVYRKAMSDVEAIEDIEKNSSSQFDPRLVEAFIEIMKEPNAMKESG